MSDRLFECVILSVPYNNIRAVQKGVTSINLIDAG